MNLNEIAPTKSNLLEFKEQLNFAKDGHNLLEQKREILVMKLLEIISKIKNLRKKLHEKLGVLYGELLSLQLYIGEPDLIRLIQSIHDEPRLNIQEHSIMGIRIPNIHLRQDKKHSVFSDSHHFYSNFDKIHQGVNEIMSLILLIAQTENAAWRLANEIKKTQRRVNALDSIFIPDFNQAVKYIQDSLEERERENLFQLKKIKKNQE